MSAVPSDQPRIPARKSSAARWSVVLGILGWTLCPLGGSIAAVVLGHVARNEMQSSPDLTGRGAAAAGLILGYSGLVMDASLLVLTILGVYGGAGWTPT
jgi:hypothetical protein